MGKWVYWLVIAGLCLVIGMVAFPSLKGVVVSNTTSSFSPLLLSVNSGLPYALVFFIGYAAWMAAKKKGQ